MGCYFVTNCWRNTTTLSHKCHITVSTSACPLSLNTTMNVNFADETRRNCKKKLGSQCLFNESNRKKIYRVLRINASHAMSVKKKKKNMFRSKGNVCRDSKNLHTQQCWATEKIEKPVFRPFAFRKQNLPFSFSLFFFCCIFTFHLLCFECVFQWDASEKLPALLYSSFTLCSLPISW